MNADQMNEFVELCKHPAIAGKKGALLCGDEVYHHRYGISIFCEFCDEGQREVYESHIWLPKTEDREHPERGLWGMVDWLNWELETLFSVEIAPVVIDTRQVSNIPLPEAMPLPLALAKAVIWQHERRRP